MKELLLLFVWIGIPLGLCIASSRRVHRIWMRCELDRVLYAFSKVRDSVAFLAAKRELSENSELFKLLYVINSKVIHDFKQPRVRILQLSAASSEGSEHSSAQAQARCSELTRLRRELEEAGPEINSLVDEYALAVTKLIMLSTPLRWWKQSLKRTSNIPQWLLAACSKLAFCKIERQALEKVLELTNTLRCR